MAVIEPCVYRDGELMAPALLPTLEAKARLALPQVSRFPTFDIGYTHIFTMTGWGLSYAAAHASITRKVARFYSRMNQVEGFSTIKIDKSQDYTPLNQNYYIAYSIMYVIEKTGSPTQRPDCPYPEYQSDVIQLGFEPETAAVLNRR